MEKFTSSYEGLVKSGGAPAPLAPYSAAYGCIYIYIYIYSNFEEQRIEYRVQQQSVYSTIGKHIAIDVYKGVNRPIYKNKCVYLLQYHHKTKC